MTATHQPVATADARVDDLRVHVAKAMYNANRHDQSPEWENASPAMHAFMLRYVDAAFSVPGVAMITAPDEEEY